MKQVAATAIILLLLFFLLPFLLIRGDPLNRADDPKATLPIEHTVVSPVPSGPLDSATQIKVKLPDGTVSDMTMGDYLWRVLAAEMPASFEPEALKSQAVAARTYAMRKIGTAPANHPEADVCTDHTCCQAYVTPEAAASNWGDSAAVYTAKIKSCVSGTDGVVARYDGQLIDAVFFSSAAGKTVDAVAVWGNAVPYLTSVDSPEGEEVPNYHSTVQVAAADFKSKFLAAHADAKLDGEPTLWLGEVVRNAAGGVESMQVGGVPVSGGEMRSLFALRSSNFTATVENGAISFSVTGYGHGVGMSQYGANALAKAGKSYEEILKWYYTGITLETDSTGN